MKLKGIILKIIANTMMKRKILKKQVTYYSIQAQKSNTRKENNPLSNRSNHKNLFKKRSAPRNHTTKRSARKSHISRRYPPRNHILRRWVFRRISIIKKKTRWWISSCIVRLLMSNWIIFWYQIQLPDK